MTRRIAPQVTALGPILGLSAYTNPYDPAQRALGGGLLGVGARAAIGAAAGGGHGAALGAAIGGAARRAELQRYQSTECGRFRRPPLQRRRLVASVQQPRPD